MTRYFTFAFCLAFVMAAQVSLLSAHAMPLPWTRELTLETPPMTGDDVTILQTLLQRSDAVDRVYVTGFYDSQTENAVEEFQKSVGLEMDTGFTSGTANAVLDLLSYDGYKDNNFTAASMGYLYKVHIPVYQNRSIEVTATLYDRHNNILLKFPARLHGHDNAISPQPAWPDYNNTGYGLNQFTSDGNTPTGLSEFDFNSPEDNAQLYGPYPINRVVNGLEGNAALLLPNIRSGILLHTGEWPTYDPSMPNSAGCVHAHPDDIKTISQILPTLGVKENDNPNGAWPYPYQPQGLISIEQVDGPL